MKRCFILLIAGMGVVFADPIVITILSEVGINEDSTAWVELHQDPPMGYLDLTGCELKSNTSVCTLTCQLAPDEFLVIDSAVIAQGIIGHGSFRLNPRNDRVVFLAPYPIPIGDDSVLYPRFPTGWSYAPAPPVGASIASVRFRNDPYFLDRTWYIDLTPTPGATNDDYNGIQGVVTWDPGLTVTEGMVTAFGKYGYWSSPIGAPSPDTYQIFPLGSDRYWIEGKVYTQEYGWLYNSWPESVDVGFGETLYGINIHLSPQGMKEVAIPQYPRRLTPKATIARNVLKLETEDGERNTVSGLRSSVLFNITGRRVLDLVPGANDIRHLTPSVYLIRRKSGFYKIVITR